MELVEDLRANGPKSSTTTPETPKQGENLKECGLDTYDCPVCNNTGEILYEKNGMWYGRECECMNRRRSIRRITTSGMTDLLDRYTFANYETPDENRAVIKARAMAYCEDKAGWFYFGGRSGSGKTHLCTAICGELIRVGMNVRYVLWKDMSVQAKASMTDSDAYERIIEPLKKIQVLYIDDLFKVGKGAEPTQGDVNLAFEILNARYNDRRKMTIISTELPIEDVLSLDEALGSRIYERAKGNILSAPDENWRMRN